MDTHAKTKILTYIKEYTLIIIGCFLVAVAMDIFLVPNKIASGGATGFSTVIYHLTSGKLPAGLIIIAVNIPLFLLSIKHMGRSFFIKSVISTILLSLFVDLFNPVAKLILESYFPDLALTEKNTDLLLLCLFGGVLMGVGIGLVFRMGGTTGGTDIAAVLIQRLIPYASIGQLILIVDAFVVIFAAIVFKSFLLTLYAIVVIYVSTKIIDGILEGVNFAKSVYIISDYPEEISELIMKELDRGVTALDGKGMYTDKEKKVLLCVLEKTQIPRLKTIVKDFDPKAFIVMTDVREVLGDFGRGKK